MSYEDMIGKVAEMTGVSRAKVKDVIEALGETTVEGLKNDGRVRIPAFGVFEVRQRAARVGRNPQTGEQINISASQRVGFKMSAKMKAEIS